MPRGGVDGDVNILDLGPFVSKTVVGSVEIPLKSLKSPR